MPRYAGYIAVLLTVAVFCGCPVDSPPVVADIGDTNTDATDAADGTCVPTTCDELGEVCGEQDDGCGGTLTCGSCVAELMITPSPLSVKLGARAQLNAQAQSADGSIVENVDLTWESSDPSVATVDQNGLVTGESVGSTEIGVATDDISQSVSVTVTDTSVARVDIESDDLELGLGETVDLSVKTYDESDNELMGRAVTWSSSDEAVADISSTGTVEATGAGQATITAEVEGVSDDVGVVVEAKAIEAVQMRPEGPHVLGRDDTLELRASATALDGTDAFCNFQWSSSNPEAVTIDSQGMMTGRGAGISTISAECRGVSDSVTVYANDTDLSDPLLDSADLQLWLRADVGLDFAGGNRVELWRDISGNQRTLESLSFNQHPDRINGVVNGHPVLRFFGGQDLRLASTSLELPRASIFVVVRNDEPTHTGRILSNCLVENGTHHLSFNGTDNGLVFFGDNGVEMNMTLTTTTSEFQVFSVIMSASQVAVYENGTPQSVDNTAVSGSWFFQQIGAECNTLGLEGDVAEVILYRRALSETEREEVESYLMSRYGF